jgi:hypothetical protein
MKTSDIKEYVVGIVKDFEKIPCDTTIKKAEKMQELKALAELLQEQLQSIRSTITKGTNEIDAHLTSKFKELANVKEIINSPIHAPSSSTVQPTKTWSEVAALGGTTPPTTVVATITKDVPETQKVEIVPGIFVEAFKIKSDKECFDHRGYLCVDKRSDKICYALNDTIVRGRITRILSKDSPVCKWRSFNPYIGNADTDNKFYHEDDPTDYHWLTNRMEYYPASANQNNTPLYSYGIGDRNYMMKDLQCATSPQLKLSLDLAAHFALTAYLISTTMDARHKK